MTLKERIAQDTYRVFLREADFADKLKVGTDSQNCVSILGSMQANEVDNNSGSGIYLQSFSHTLLAAYPLGGKLSLNAGQILFINDISYRVVDLMDEMGVATIHLKKG